MTAFARCVTLAGLVAVAACAASSGANAPAQASIGATQFAPSVAIAAGEGLHTGSGVEYKDIRVGTGSVAGREQEIVVRYLVYLPDARLVGGGTDSPLLTVRLTPESVIRAWYDAIPGMRVGGIRRFIVPPRLGYGSKGHGAIPPNAVVVFDVELFSVR